jgi:hypothetical protein
MEFVLFDQPWRLFCLPYLGLWFIIFFCADPRNFPPAEGGSPAGPAATPKAGAEDTE